MRILQFQAHNIHVHNPYTHNIHVHSQYIGSEQNFYIESRSCTKLYDFHSPEKLEKQKKNFRRGASRHGSCRSRIRACYVENSPRIKRRASTIIRESRVDIWRHVPDYFHLSKYYYIFCGAANSQQSQEQYCTFDFKRSYRLFF